MSDSQNIAALQVKVAELESKLNYVMQHLNLSYSAPAAPHGMEDVMNLIRQGNTLEAIKIYRAKSNTGLNEAKEAVARMAAQMGIH